MQRKINILTDARDMTKEEMILSVMEKRKINDPASFFHPIKNDLIDFKKLKGIEEAAERVIKAIDNNENILLYADVDVDGVTSAAIMYRYLANFTDNYKVAINKGKMHGVSDVPVIALTGIDLMIIVDSIEDNPDTYQRILEAGCDIVILDHHIISNKLKESSLPIYLVSSANDYPNAELSGAGVAWKFCSYLDYLTLNDYAESLVDLATCGIVADMSDLSELSSENRYICSEGFKNLHNPAIKAVLGDYPFNATAVSFSIAPIVNSAMRMENNEEALELFLTDDDDRIEELIASLKQCRVRQNKLVDSVYPMLVSQAEKQKNNKCLIFDVGETEYSVAGLLANKLMAEYQRPVLVLHDSIEVDDDTGEMITAWKKGSGRGVGVSSFKELFDKTEIGWASGHENAFGCGIPIDDFEAFKIKIEEVLADVELKENINCDLQITIDQITPDLIAEVKEMNKISGTGFDPITVYIDDISGFKMTRMSEGKHLKLNVPGLTILEWNSSSNIPSKAKLAVYGQLDRQVYYGRGVNQLIADGIIIEG